MDIIQMALQLKIVALTLLIAVMGATNITPEMRQTATDAANQGIMAADIIIANPLVVGSPNQPVDNPVVNNIQPVINQPVVNQPEPQPTINPTKIMKLDVIQKTYNTDYKVAGQVEEPGSPIDNGTFVSFWVVVRNEDNEPVRDATLEVTSTDASQSKTMAGTGSVSRKKFLSEIPDLPGDIESRIPIYQYTYEFRSAGTHTVTFKVGDISTEKTFQVK